MDYLLVALGLGLLVAGGEVLLRGALGLSVRLGLSPAIIGAVVMGFGTSSPELAASVTAALAGEPGIALGNVIGSNIANVALILAAAAIVAPIVARNGPIEVVFLILSVAALIALILLGQLGFVMGLVFLAILAGYIITTIRAGQVDAPDDGDVPKGSLALSAGFAIVGLALLVGGAQALVAGAVSLAEDFGVPPAIIGLTIVAIGTSLPELAASLAAAIRGQGAMALGNIVGSNIFNVFGILGITALVRPLDVSPSFGMAEIAVLLITTVAVIGLGYLGRIGRIAGAAGLALYAGYVVLVLA